MGKASRKQVANPKFESKREETLAVEKIVEEDMQRNNYVADLKNRVADRPKKHRYSAEEEGLLIFYQDMVPGDTTCPIYIDTVSEFLETFIKENHESFYQMIRKFYGIERNIIPMSEKKYKKTAELLDNFYSGIRTIKNAFLYSKYFSDTMYKCVIPKFDAPEGTTDAEIVKWARVWYFIMKDLTFFSFDVDVATNTILEKNIKDINEKYLLPESMISVSEYFNHFEEKDFSIELMKKFLESFPEELQKKVYEWAELTDLYDRSNSYYSMGELRLQIKAKLFPNFSASLFDPFIIKSAMRTSSPEDLKLAWKVYREISSIDELSYKEYDRVDVTNLRKTKKYKFYEVGKVTLNDGSERVLYVNSWNELLLYVNLMSWWYEHPHFLIGDKNFFENGMLEAYFPKADYHEYFSVFLEELEIFNWKNPLFDQLVDMVFPSSDINICRLFMKYRDAEISAQDISKLFGNDIFKIIDFSTGYIDFDPIIFKKQISAIKSQTNNSSLRNKTFMRLLRYLSKNNPICGKDKKYFKEYGIVA